VFSFISTWWRFNVPVTIISPAFPLFADSAPARAATSHRRGQMKNLNIVHVILVSARNYFCACFPLITWLHSCVYFVHYLLSDSFVRCRSTVPFPPHNNNKSSLSLTLSVVSVVYVAYLILILLPWFLSWIKHTKFCLR